MKKVLMLSSVMALSGCAPVVFMGAATTVTQAASEERGFTGAVSDATINTKIQAKWLNHNADLVKEITVVVRQGRVLLTGEVSKPQMQIDAVRLAWQVGGVKEVLNETTVGDQSSLKQYAKDTWISTQLKSKLLLNNDIRSLNYNVQVMNGVVYLMGIAQSKSELDHVVHYARNISGVKRVTSYVTIKPAGAAGTATPPQDTTGEVTGDWPAIDGNMKAGQEIQVERL